MTDETSNEPNLKIIDFQKKRKDTKLKNGDAQTKYDFTFNGTKYLLKFDVYRNGVVCTYVYHGKTNMGPFQMEGLKEHREVFYQLNWFDKVLNFFGAKITVDEKLVKSLPKFKDETLKSLEINKELHDRQKELEEKFQ